MYVSRYWRMRLMRYRLEGVRDLAGGPQLQGRLGVERAQEVAEDVQARTNMEIMRPVVAA
jgi:hypothetical protein